MKNYANKFAKRQKVKTFRRGMKIGSKHKWLYKGIWDEKKISPKKWIIKFENTKSRRGHYAPYGTGMPVGSKIIWGFKNMKQIATKITPNKYKTTITGIKYRKAYKTKGRWKK